MTPLTPADWAVAGVFAFVVGILLCMMLDKK